jgi:hypothetical protein
MEPPRGWRPPPGGRAPLQVPPSNRRARYQPDRPTPWPLGKPADGLPTLPRWKRLMLMYIMPVCLALVWQLAVIIGCLALFLLGLTLLKLLRL